MPELDLIFFPSPGGGDASLNVKPKTPQAEWQAACS